MVSPNVLKTAADTVKMVVAPGPAIFEKLIETTSKISGSDKELERIAVRAEMQQRIVEAKVKIIQEYAIAFRIGTAETVEVEEYYGTDNTGKVNVGLDDHSINAGVSGGARRVTKRVYRFIGSVNSIDDIMAEYTKLIEKIAEPRNDE